MTMQIDVSGQFSNLVVSRDLQHLYGNVFDDLRQGQKGVYIPLSNMQGQMNNMII